MHPEERYQLEIQSKGALMVRNWEYQSPYVRVVSKADGETIELPDAKMVSNTQVLEGIVVDPTGKPVSGVTVNANLASGGMLSRTSSITNHGQRLTNKAASACRVYRKKSSNS